MDPPPPTTAIGVDFSGAKDAGRHIWIAELEVDDDGADLQRCVPAEALDFGGRSLSDALYGLSTELRARTEAVFGLDVPFGLPEPLVEADSWARFLADFPDRFGGPDAFREASKEAGGGTELRRVTDDEAETPFSPYNHRIYRQTYAGLNDLLHPLVKGDRVRALPMQTPKPDRAWAVEVCPAATLKDWGLYGSYKDASGAARGKRADILDAVADRRGIDLGSDLRDRLLDDAGADGIDALVAADAAARAVRDGPRTVDPDAAYALEGYVYV